MGREERVVAGALGAIALLAAAAVVRITAAGPTVSADGLTYLQMAAGQVPVEQPIAGHFPGGYPFALSVAGALGFGRIAAVRAVAAAVAAANVVLAGAVGWREAGPRWALPGAALVAVASPLAPLYGGAFSEPLFVTFLLATVLSLGGAGRRPTVLAGVLAGASMFVRFAGVAVVAGGLVAAVARRDRRWSAFAAGAAVPVLAWMLTYEAGVGRGDRALAWHPPHARSWGGALRAMSTWVRGQPTGSVLGAAVGIGALGLLVRARRLPGGDALLPLALAYAATLAVTVVAIDALTPLDGRLLSPLLVLVALAVPALSTTRWPAVGGLVAVVVVAVHLRADTRLLGPHERGALALRTSPTVAAAEALDGPIASNGPAALWLFDVDAAWIPRRTNPLTERPQPGFDDAVDQLRVRLGRGGHVVWLERYAYRRYLPSGEDLARRLGAVLVARYPDGAIYRLP